MKSVIMQVRIIPGTSIRQAVFDLISLSQEMDCMIEANAQGEGVVLHILPTTTQDQAEQMLTEKVGSTL